MMLDCLGGRRDRNTMKQIPRKLPNFRKRSKKRRQLIDHGWTIVTIDQHHKPVATIRPRGWLSTGSNPTVEVSGSRHGVTILGAISHEGESFCTWSEETLTAPHGIRLLQAIHEEFGEKVIVLLDQAPYFYAKNLWEFVGGDRATETNGETSIERVIGETLCVWYFRPHAPQLNPVESFWNQLESWFKS
jgi:hypothetical protein